jgi:ABC-type multidrug transport system permease subunit
VETVCKRGREEKLEQYQRLTPTRRLQFILLLMALWDLLGAIVQLFFDSFLFSAEAQPSGILAGRAFSGALVIPAVLYLYAARNPFRHRSILWLAVIEQLVAICTGVFHWAAEDLKFGGVVVPVAVAIAFLILVLLNFPRGEEGELAAADVELEPQSAVEGEADEE